MSHSMRIHAIIYARFSERRNAAECRSIEKQIDHCRRHCELHDWSVAACYDDAAMSGARADNRPGLQTALDHACRVGGAFVSYELSRWARSTKDALVIAERLSKAGAHLVSLREQIDTTTAMGRFTYTLMAALAELEREQTAERTRDAMLHHQAKGRRMSDRPPYGWMNDPCNSGELVRNRTEQATIAIILRLYESGKSLRAIGRELSESGNSCRGGDWHHSTIKRVIDRVHANVA